MVCYRPLHGYYARQLNETGKRSLVFTLADGYADRPISVPCGRCIGCRLERARQWSVRCMHEVKLYERNCFVTLTYDDANVPRLPNGKMTLEPRDMVLFLKKLRFRYGAGIRFFQCGEYGDKLERPHHHALLFNHAFDDRVCHGDSGSGAKLYVSKELSKLWPHGFASIGEATFESAGYIARYTMKKCGKDWQDKDPVLDGRVREYLTMSRRPGIGHDWALRYSKDYFPSDEVVVNGKVCRPPRYYDNIVSKKRPWTMRVVKEKRRKKAAECEAKRVMIDEASHFSAEMVKSSAVSLLSRDLE